MAGLGFLTSALGSTGSLNWTWTIELIVCIILVLFFLFYFNRLFATVLSYSLRAYTWHKFHIWIDIQALQISFLAGRIFFKGIRYHGENETIYIQNGYMTWRYWQDSSRQVDLTWNETEKKEVQRQDDDTSSTQSASSKGVDKPKDISPRPVDTSKARISINVTGLEWFIYNRGPVYDAILREVFRDTASPVPDVSTNSNESDETFEMPNTSRRKTTRGSSADHGSLGARSSIRDSQMARTGTASIQLTKSLKMMRRASRATSEGNENQELTHISSFYSMMVQALPVAVECVKGAVLLGNENTRALVVTTFTKATGHLDAAAAGPLDIFKQAFEFEIEHPVVRMRPNPDFRRPQFSTAERILRALDSPQILRKWWQFSFSFRERRRNMSRRLHNLIPAFRSSVLSLKSSAKEKSGLPNYSDLRYNPDDENEWHGLTRYLDDNEADDHEAWFSIEYARFSTLVEAPAVRLNFYWDNAGPVREAHAIKARNDPSRDINGTTPPTYGLDLIVRGGTVNYGPWADRLRAEIQTAFLPSGYTSVTPAEPIAAGDPRQSTIMIIRIDIQEELMLRIPTKERSKDWQWRGRASAVRDAAALRKQREKKHFRFRNRHKSSVGMDVRPFGWIAVKVGPGSSVQYDMDMIARRNGYHNSLTLDLKTVEATSSVNHAPLWSCPSHRVVADLPNTLQWNGLHTWKFKIESDSMDMFMLRDHMFLLTDLISDFTAGAKSDYMTFVPFRYCMEVGFTNFKLFLNANDYNIIDSPSNLDENSFLVLGFESLDGTVDIPLDTFAPELSSVVFNARGQNARFDLKTPLWSTLHTFMDSECMATLKVLTLDGNYNYNSANADHLTDCLFMDITGTGTRAYLQGYLIRYFMNVQENYFGEHLHFRTFEEYQDLLTNERQNRMSTPRPGGKKDNDLDVVLSIRADDSQALMPANIYSRKDNVRFDILLVEADMRFTNYYMDLQVNFSPVEAALDREISDEDGTRTDVTNCQLFIDGISVYGHRLFGAPPTEPTYICNWDFEVGDITGELSTTFLRIFINAIQAFVFTLDDFENALPELTTIAIHDITFLRAKLAGIKLWLISEQAAVLLEVANTDVNFNDWAGLRFAKCLSANVPQLKVAVVDVQSGAFREGRKDREIPTWAFVQLSARISTLDKSKNLVEFRHLQQQHVRYHDLRTHRADLLLHPSERPTSSLKQPDWSIPPPAMPLPLMPNPVQNHVPVTKAKTRNGFIVPSLMTNSEASSITSIKENTPRTPYTQQMPKISRPIVEIPGQNRKQSADKMKPSFVTFSSRWASPHFAMLHLEPDSKYLPQPLKSPRMRSSRIRDDNDVEGINFEQTQNTPHLGILLELEKGLVGFCTPELASAISGLIDELTVKEPSDQLDAMQYDAVSKVMKTFADDKPRSMLDLEVRLPLIHVRLVHEQTNHGAPEYFPPPPDLYDIKIIDTRVSFRMRPRMFQGQILGTDDDVLAFLSTQQLAIVFKDGTLDNPKLPNRAEITLSDLNAWWSAMGRNRAKVQFNDLDLCVLGTESVRFTDYIRRNIVMIDMLKSPFVKDVHEGDSKRLIYHLAQLGPRTTDPIFLIKPSYVLRSAEQHLRNSDTWKIISRLRHIYQSLELQNETELVRSCTCRHQHLDHEARKEVQTSFEQWGGWNPDDNDHTAVMDSIYAPAESTAKSPLDINMEAEAIVDRIHIAVHHSHRQSSLTLRGLDLGFMAATENRGYDEHHNPRPKQQKIVFQNYLADFNLNIHWDVLDVVRYFLENKSAIDKLSKPATPSPTATQAPTIPFQQPMDFYIVFGSDQATIYVQSINLRLKLGTKNLRASCLLSTNGQKPTAAMVSLAPGLAEAKLEHKSQTLLSCRLSSPKIFASWLPHNGESIKHSRVQLCGACDRIRFDLQKDAPAILQIVESIINDEVKEVIDLMKLVPPSPPKPTKGKTSRLPPADVVLNLAFFLNDYEIRLALLPTIRYQIKGQVARTSITSQAGGAISLNFDLKQHLHRLNHTNEKTAEAKSLALAIPPINSRVLIKDTGNMVQVRAHTAIELVTAEATVLRAWFDALNRSEVISSFQALGRKGEQISQLINRVVPPASPSVQKVESAASEKPTLVQFIVHATCGGFNVHCRAPSLREENSQADLDIGLRSVSIRVHNRSEQSNSVTKWPQFEVNVRQLGFGIRRTEQRQSTNYGHFTMGIKLSGTSEVDPNGEQLQVYKASSSGLSIDLYEETASLVVDITAFLRERLSSITLAEEAKNIKPLRRLTITSLPEETPGMKNGPEADTDLAEWMLFHSVYAVNLDQILVRWRPRDQSLLSPGRELEDAVFSIRNIDLQTRQEGSARLSILDLQLQLVPQSRDPLTRTGNSALLPEIVFSAAYQSSTRDRRFAFQAKGKALDLRLSSDFVVPAKSLQKSLTNASEELQAAKSSWVNTTIATTSTQKSSAPFFSGKPLASLLIDADFAGAVVSILPKQEDPDYTQSPFSALKGTRRPRAGRYGQAVQGDNAIQATLKSPGVAFKIGYYDDEVNDPVLNAEIKVAASSNTLYPTVVPLILEISSSIKETMGDSPQSEPTEEEKPQNTSYLSDAALKNADPTNLLGRCKLNAGLLIERQEFSLSCQPIGRVAATARFQDISVIINTVQSQDHGRFFSILLKFNRLGASVQHVYSRESTASFDVESIVVSLMNSKHVSANTGISAILNISPLTTNINAKQLQDFMLFREIWYPAELRGPDQPVTAQPSVAELSVHPMQRYQQMSTEGALPWNAVVSIELVQLSIDFGQGLGKADFKVSKLWASSKKGTDSEQNLCVGIERIGIDCVGRTSGFIELANLRVRTSIYWRPNTEHRAQTPLIQASARFDHFRLKTSFDYQPFAVADISFFEFMMYNVSDGARGSRDRLVAILDGGKVQAFCTTGTAAQTLFVYQAFERLIQENHEAYEASIVELDRHIRRRSVFPSTQLPPASSVTTASEKPVTRGQNVLSTDVVVSLKALDAGIFPNTFYDTQVLKADAIDVRARFSVNTSEHKTHSVLGMRLGEVRVALSSVSKPTTTALGEVSVLDVIERATTSKGGTIVRVPELVASMQTWQEEDSNSIEYIFRSIFKGKVDVGWNYSRISFIRSMWTTHSKSLAQRLGKPLPQSAVKITAHQPGESVDGREKITAVVNMPQSKYQYIALEPPVIDTPQLRDMGEATPPLEWIGLHRDKLPEATHSIAIISLLEIAKEVEGAYMSILGSTA